MIEKVWQVFYCKSRAEKKSWELLDKRGYIAYLPLYQSIRQWSDRKKKVALPLFPGYLFVFCSRAEFSDIMQAAPGLVAPVKIGTTYAILKPGEIELLKQIETSGLEAMPVVSKPETGDRVKICSGPLKDFEGTCIEEHSENYLLVHIEAVNQYIKIRIHASKLKILS
jgi:transcription antitermination factor NusG